MADLRRMEEENSRVAVEAEARAVAVEREREVTFRNQQDEIRDLKRQIEGLKRIEAEVRAHYEKLQADLSSEVETLRAHLEAEVQMRQDAQRQRVASEERAEARCA